MEFKDKLKKLRQDKGITQQALADAIFVSRSTVAKWENGLGLPNPESMQALEEYFGIRQEEMATSEPEAVIVQKNRRLRLIGKLLGWTAILAITILMCILPFAIHSGDYGFTPEMAAGVFADNAYIDTGDYRIYYHTFEGDWEDGQHWEILSAFRPVEQHFWGWTVSEEDYDFRVITQNNYVVGRLTSIQGKNGYYNLIGVTISNEMPSYIVTVESVSINGVEYEVQQGFFFITPEPVEYFRIGDVFLNVE